MRWIDFIRGCSYNVFSSINWAILTFLVISGATAVVICMVIFLYLFAAVAHSAEAVKTFFGII